MKAKLTDEKQVAKEQTKDTSIKNADSPLSAAEYLYRVRWTILCIAAVTFLTHGSILFSQRFGIDTDLIMNGNHAFETDGRQGLVWLARFLNLGWFNLYLAQVFALVFMTLFPVSAGYLFSRMGRQRERLNLSLLVLGLSMVVSPFWVEQIYFLNQSPQVLLACTLIPVTVLLVEAARTDISHKWYCLILSIALMQVIFACYQAVVMVYITTVTAAFLLSFLKEEYPIKKGLQWIGFHAGIFCVGLALYWITSQLFFMENFAYLTNQLRWGNKLYSSRYILRHLRQDIIRTLKYNPPYYTGMYGVFCLLLAVISLHMAIRKKERKYLLFLAAEVFFMFTPYVFFFIYGQEAPPRIQLTMPLSQGGILYLTVLLWNNMNASDTGTGKKVLLILKKYWGLILAVCLYWDTLSHLNSCTRFYYTDEWQYQYSRYMAEEILSEIDAVKKQNGLDSSYNKIVILGSPDIPYNDICTRDSLIRTSLFCMDVPFFHRDRIVYFLKNNGYRLDIDASDDAWVAWSAYFTDYFAAAADAMPSYPDIGYVQYLKNDEIGLDYIVIKLGKTWGKMQHYNSLINKSSPQ